MHDYESALNGLCIYTITTRWTGVCTLCSITRDQSKIAYDTSIENINHAMHVHLFAMIIGPNRATDESK